MATLLNDFYLTPVSQAIYEISDPAQEDEPNTLALMVTPDMKPGDVVQKVLQIIR